MHDPTDNRAPHAYRGTPPRRHNVPRIIAAHDFKRNMRSTVDPDAVITPRSVGRLFKGQRP